MTYVKVKEIHATLGKALKYIANPDKTDQGSLVSSNFQRDASDHRKAEKAMLHDVDSCVGGRVENSVLAYHVIQSFAPGETTPEQCHRLGEELARRISGDEHKYVVATHLDRDHLHNHIIICSANECTRRKMRVIPKRKNGTLKQWRQISDELSRAENLTVIEPSKHPTYVEGMEGLYTIVKGTSAKDTMRRRIELALSESDEWEAFTRILHDKYAVSTSVRGHHLTFTAEDTGFKVRDVKLGQAFDQSSLMARLRHAPVREITFNKRMIAHRDGASVHVWLPKTHRSEQLSIPTEYIITDGTTYRAFLTANQEQIITDQNGAYRRSALPDELYAHFAPPTIAMSAIADAEMRPSIGISEAQQRYYRSQAIRIDRLRDDVRLLNAMADMHADGTSHDAMIEDLSARIEHERAEFQAELIACADGVNAPDMDPQTRLKARELRIRELGRQLDVLRRNAPDTERKEQRKPPQRRHR